MSRAPNTIALSLVSHTNVGKTTLARTLLGRDVGEVRDAAHVTEFADVHTMLETPQAERLLLWDTPGFGDSVRLVKRLRASSQPLGWFLAEVWDRFRDRPFWSSQQAVRNVRDEADVILYLVNAAEQPEAAGYVQPEMELLAWLAKPVIVLLNQLGAPREPAVEAVERTRWQQHLAAHPHVAAVLPLDAFARCWVQEVTLLRSIEAVLNGAARERMARLRAAWLAQRMATFEAAMQCIADSLARLACASQALPTTTGLRERVRDIGRKLAPALGIEREGEGPIERAQTALAEQLAAELHANTLALIRLHGLRGDAQREILARVATHYELRLRMDEGRAALWGGMVTGALAGLKADIATGGLTLGGGLLAGGLIGALGAAGIARCVNLVRGTDRSWLAWNAEALDQMLEAALLRYLAVAHFGRGRGDWSQGESPPHWRVLVQASIEPLRGEFASVWRERDVGAAGAAGVAEAERPIAAALAPLLERAAAAALRMLYPDAALRESAQPAAPPSQ